MYSQNSAVVVVSDMDYLDVKNLAGTGEGTFLEFKQRVPNAPKIAREMAAFANTKGGTILVGVDDEGSLIGVEGYQEEEFLLRKAAFEVCKPKIDISIEVVQFGRRDLLVVRIPEAPQKPVFITLGGNEVVYMRDKDQNKTASIERIKIIENRNAGQGVTFEYGTDEQTLFRYLNEYNEISVTEFSNIIDVPEREAGRILVNLVSAGVLNLNTRENTDYYSFSRNCKA